MRVCSVGLGGLGCPRRSRCARGRRHARAVGRRSGGAVEPSPADPLRRGGRRPPEGAGGFDGATALASWHPNRDACVASVARQRGRACRWLRRRRRGERQLRHEVSHGRRVRDRGCSRRARVGHTLARHVARGCGRAPLLPMRFRGPAAGGRPQLRGGWRHGARRGRRRRTTDRPCARPHRRAGRRRRRSSRSTDGRAPTGSAASRLEKTALSAVAGASRPSSCRVTSRRRAT